MKELGEGKVSIEAVKDYWDSRPCNIRHSEEEVGTKKYFDEVEARRYFVEPHISDFANFKKYAGKKVLEIGCGIGTDGVNFAREGCIYTGTELSAESLSIAKKRFDIFGLKGDFFCLNAEKIDETVEGKFDLIYSFGVIHHSPYPKKIIEAASRLMRPGAELKLMVYAKNSWKAAMIEAGFDQPEAQSGCPIALSFDDNDILDLVSDWFDINNISQRHIFPYIIEEYKQYKYKMHPWFESMPKEMFSALEKNFGWHKMVTATKR